MLLVADHWPREHCGYTGPLVSRIAVSNLGDTYATVPDKRMRRITHASQRPVVPNRDPEWHLDVEWDHRANVDDVLEQALAQLARQLQFGYFARFKTTLRSAVATG